jgi:TonB family protein
MRRKTFLAFAIISLFALCVCIASAPARAQAPQPPPITAPKTDSDIESDLRTFMERFVAVACSRANADVSSYVSPLQIPDSAAWFLKNFGSVDGQRLESRYDLLWRRMAQELLLRVAYACRAKSKVISIALWKDTSDPNDTWIHPIFAAMAQPVTIYTARATGKNGSQPIDLGQYVYVDGGFRYVDALLFLGLSGQPSPIIRVASDPSILMIARNVAPEYPGVERMAHIPGEVTVRILVDTNGKVTEAEPVNVNGGADFVGPAVLAVKQWQYQPLYLPGPNPPQIQSTVEVGFQTSPL